MDSGANNGRLSLLAVEQRSGLFERTSLGLNDKDVDEGQLEHKPAAVDDLSDKSAFEQPRTGKIAYVVLPLKFVEGNRVNVLVEDEREGDGEVEHVETLGTESEGQDLDSVRDDERRESKTMEIVRSVKA